MTRPEIYPDALQAMRKYDWPGNIRELKNVIQSCLIRKPDRAISRVDLPPSVLDKSSRVLGSESPGKLGPPTRPFRSILVQTPAQAELVRITEALEKHGNNRLQAARELGMSRMRLYKRLHQYGFMPPTAD